MDPPVQVLKTERLLLRHLGPDDAPFILRLLNEPSWIANIGDRGVRTIADAQRYLDKGPIEMYGRLGFGLYLVCLADNEVPIGLCGLLKRERLDDVDLGFAFLPDYWGRGYAHESSAAVLSYPRRSRSLRDESLPKVVIATIRARLSVFLAYDSTAAEDSWAYPLPQ